MRPKLPFRKPRSRAKEGPAFVFVDADAEKRHDQDVRVIIRRQAARSGFRRSRDEGLHKPTALTLPQHDSPDASSPTPTPQLSYNGYETLRVRYNFDITDLTSFTDVDLGKIAYLSLRDQPARLARLLQKQPSSFLSYLPSRYGSSPCLDDAIHCVAARAGQMLGFPIATSKLSSLYGRALASLRTACQDADHRLQADVYCATRLLALYELIGLPESNHWIHHNRGGIKLVELRGPENHTSRFDRMLLKSQGPSIVVDEMYRNETSIFETAGWQTFFAHASETEPEPDSSLWWKFFGTITFMPGILKDIRMLVTGPQSVPGVSKEKILARAKQMHMALHHSHVMYQHRPPHRPSLFDLPVAVESQDRVRLRGFLLYVTMYICRVEATLSPTAIGRAAGEVEAQTFASQALLIEQMTAQQDPAMTWHLGQRNALAHSIIRTREEWYVDTEQGRPGEELQQLLGRRWLQWEDSWRDEYLRDELSGANIDN